MKLRFAFLILCAVLAVGCAGNGRRSAKTATQTVPKPVDLSIPVPPAMMSDPTERAAYVLENYWQNLTPQTDSIALEQAFANWCALTEYTDRKLAAESLITAYDKAPSRILEVAERYLYDPNSPYRDEDFFGELAAHIGTDRYSAIALECSRNAVGTKAADFVYEDSRGRRHRLYDTKAAFTVLFFSNPGCNACKEIIDQFSQLGEAVDRGVIAIVNIYIDEDLEAWREYLPHYPRNWQTGFDPLLTLRDGDSYHIRAIPSVYLLSADKTVILKDAPAERLLTYLENTL